MYYQQEVCHQLTSVPGVDFFLSDITATTTGATRAVHPGLAFWVAIDPCAVSEIQIYTAMRNNVFRADLKLMTHTKTELTGCDREIKSVTMALKDFGPGYVQNKVSANLQSGSHYCRDRLYLKQSTEGLGYERIIRRAQEVLSQYGLHLQLETY